MRDNKIKELFRNSKLPPIDSVKKTDAVNSLLKTANSRPMPTKRNFFEILTGQIGFINKGCFCIQFLASILGIWILTAYKASQPAKPMMLLSAVFPILILACLSEMQKSFSSGMWELETVCRYDLKMVISIRMMVLSGINLLILLLLSALCSYALLMSTAMACIYLLLPFLFTSLILFILTAKFKISTYGFYTAGIAITLAFLFLSGTEKNNIYNPVYFHIWVIALAVVLCIYIFAVIRLLNNLRGADAHGTYTG